MSYWHIHRFSSFALSFSVFAPYNRYIKIVVGVVLVSGLSGTLCPVTCTHFLLPTFQRFSFGGENPTFIHQHLTKSSSSFFFSPFRLIFYGALLGEFPSLSLQSPHPQPNWDRAHSIWLHLFLWLGWEEKKERKSGRNEKKIGRWQFALTKSNSEKTERKGFRRGKKRRWEGKKGGSSESLGTTQRSRETNFPLTQSLLYGRG